ncbi:MAG: cupredoxin domain-containing protein [Bdellovibrionota bacterium]
MKVLKNLLAAPVLFAVIASSAAPLFAAAPHASDYGTVPKKKEGVASNEGLQSVREETVTPEEVYKHGVQEVSVIATDTGFHPARIYVRRNIPVHLFLTSASPSKLCFVMDEFQIRKGVSIQQVDQVNFLPTKVGEYKFYCPVSEISGSVVVRD